MLLYNFFPICYEWESLSFYLSIRNQLNISQNLLILINKDNILCLQIDT